MDISGCVTLRTNWRHHLFQIHHKRLEAKLGLRYYQYGTRNSDAAPVRAPAVLELLRWNMSIQPSTFAEKLMQMPAELSVH
jgi:hypothetical protein